MDAELVSWRYVVDSIRHEVHRCCRFLADPRLSVNGAGLESGSGSMEMTEAGRSIARHSKGRPRTVGSRGLRAWRHPGRSPRQRIWSSARGRRRDFLGCDCLVVQRRFVGDEGTGDQHARGESNGENLQHALRRHRLSRCAFLRKPGSRGPTTAPTLGSHRRLHTRSRRTHGRGRNPLQIAEMRRIRRPPVGIPSSFAASVRPQHAAAAWAP